MAAAPQRPRLLRACYAAAAVLPWAARVQAQPDELILTGTCSHDPQDMLEGLTFRLQGRTKSGAPWYQSTEYGQYLYYDPDCSGGGDGEGWIIDGKKPSVTAERDLDGDGSCDYRARVRYGGTGAPPKSAFWFIKCRERWTWRGLRLTENPEVHEPPVTPGPGGIPPAQDDSQGKRKRTTTTVPPTDAPEITTAKPKNRSRPKGAATAAAAEEGDQTQTAAAAAAFAGPAAAAIEELLSEGLAADSAVVPLQASPESYARGKGKGAEEEPEPAASKGKKGGKAPEEEEPEPKGPKKLVLNGACEMKAHLNGAVFELQGRTRSGAPYYKAAESDEFLYHVTTCDGPDGEKTPSVWILDTEEPKKFKKSKKKTAKTKCDYNAAHLEDAILNGPPAVATWKMWCGKDKVLDLVITLVVVPESDDRNHTLVLVSGAQRLRSFAAALVFAAAAAVFGSR